MEPDLIFERVGLSIVGQVIGQDFPAVGTDADQITGEAGGSPLSPVAKRFSNRSPAAREKNVSIVKKVWGGQRLRQGLERIGAQSAFVCEVSDADAARPVAIIAAGLVRAIQQSAGANEFQSRGGPVGGDSAQPWDSRVVSGRGGIDPSNGRQLDQGLLFLLEQGKHLLVPVRELVHDLQLPIQESGDFPLPGKIGYPDFFVEVSGGVQVLNAGCLADGTAAHAGVIEGG